MRSPVLRIGYYFDWDACPACNSLPKPPLRARRHELIGFRSSKCPESRSIVDRSPPPNSSSRAVSVKIGEQVAIRSSCQAASSVFSSDLATLASMKACRASSRRESSGPSHLGYRSPPRGVSGLERFEGLEFGLAIDNESDFHDCGSGTAAESRPESSTSNNCTSPDSSNDSRSLSSFLSGLTLVSPCSLQTTITSLACA